MPSELLIPLPYGDARDIVEANPVRRYGVFQRRVIALTVVAADKNSTTFRLQAGMLLYAIGWVRTASVIATLSHYSDLRSSLTIRVLPFSIAQIGYWLLLVGFALLLLRFRFVVGVPVLIFILTWLWGTVSTTLREFDAFLQDLFGIAMPSKRD